MIGRGRVWELAGLQGVVQGGLGSPPPARGVTARAVSTKRIDPVVQWLC